MAGRDASEDTPRHTALGLDSPNEAQKLRRLAGSLARVGGWAYDPRTDGLAWTDEIQEILELAPGQGVDTRPALERYPEPHRTRIRAAIRTTLEEGQPFALQAELITFQGRRVQVQMIGEPEYGPDGQVTRVVGAVQDISDLQAATRRAQQAAAALQTTLEAMSDAVVVLDPQWRYTHVSPRAAQYMETGGADLLGRSLWDTMPDIVGTPWEQVLREAARTREPVEATELWRPATGEWFTAHVRPTDVGLTVFFRDITAQQEALRALERQAMLLDEAQDAIIVRDLDDRITFWNRAATVQYGWAREEALGADIRELLYLDAREHDQMRQEVLQQGSWAGEVHHRSRDGDDLVVECRASLLCDDQGSPEAILAINTDVTEEKSRQLQLLRAQRLESLGTLAGGVAHDLNNVLSPILMATDLLSDHIPQGTATELLQVIRSSAQRGADLVTQVLSFARGVEGERTPVDVGVLLRDIASIVRDTFPKNVDLVLDLDDEIDTVLGDSTQIQQVLLNLAVNSRDAMAGGGRLTIRAGTVHLDPPAAATIPGLQPGRHVRIEVQDSGEGMTPEVRERVFEPFFTTKPHGRGTGLGLSTVAAIVTSHGGTVQVDSRPGEGTCVRVLLPADSRDTGEPAVPEPVTSPESGDGRTVLVVDDEEPVRRMTTQVLRLHGYEVLEAADGAEAVSVCAEHRDAIDLVFMDMMMPVMDGPSAVHALRRIVPDLHVVLTSGLHADGQPRDQVEDVGFLPKPYSNRELLDTVAAALDTDDDTPS